MTKLCFSCSGFYNSVKYMWSIKKPYYHFDKPPPKCLDGLAPPYNMWVLYKMFKNNFETQTHQNKKKIYKYFTTWCNQKLHYTIVNWTLLYVWWTCVRYKCKFVWTKCGYFTTRCNDKILIQFVNRIDGALKAFNYTGGWWEKV